MFVEWEDESGEQANAFETWGVWGEWTFVIIRSPDWEDVQCEAFQHNHSRGVDFVPTVMDGKNLAEQLVRCFA